MVVPDLHPVPADLLAPVLIGFRDLNWPVDRDAMRSLARRVGWEIEIERRKGIDFRTGLGVTPDRANALLPRDGTTVGEVHAYLCDRIAGVGEVTTRTALVDTLRVIVDATSLVLGEPSCARSDTASTWWDVPSGGRIAVKRLDKVVILVVLSPEYADVERSEERQGVSPDRVPGADDEAD